jgi:fumarate hydratase class II
MTMVCVQVIGNDTAIALAGTQGNFELNVFKPVIIHNFLHSVRLLTDACATFTKYCVEGMKVNRERIAQYVLSSPMLVTALNQHIGYDNAAKVAKESIKTGKTLREVCVELGLLSGADFDRLVKPEEMTRPG